MNTLIRRTPILMLTMLIAGAVGVVPAPGTVTALACEYPCSTNETNIANGWSHVSLVETGPGTVTLQFDQPRLTFAAYFEYRIDGQTAGTYGHLFLGPDEWQYPGVGVGGGYLVPTKLRTFTADSTVEIRLALGAEYKEFFDWITFDVGPAPTSKNNCKHGGWQDYGFNNQGECVKFVNG